MNISDGNPLKQLVEQSGNHSLIEMKDIRKVFHTHMQN